MYQAAADPWGFEDRWYEQRKYAVSLALFPAARYRSAFEPGCSIGVLTRMEQPGAATRCCLAMWRPPRSARPPGAPQTCPRSGSSSASCPEAGRPAASTSSKN